MAYDQYVRNSIAGQGTIGGDGVPKTQTLTFAAAQTCNFDSGVFATVTATANFTSLTLSGGVAGGIYTLKIVQDSTGSRTLSGADSKIKWMGTTYLGTTHSAPTLTTTASKADVFTFVCDGTNYWEIARQVTV
jgi:hypothetical protein